MMRILTSIWMVILVAIILLGVRYTDSKYVKILRYKTWDAYQQIEPRQDHSDMVTVVNITEKDLEKYGQWPWPRHVMAMLHAQLGESKPALVNYNILFAEEDRMSGKNYLDTMPLDKEVRKQLESVLLDTDQVFAYMMDVTGNVVLMQSVKDTSSLELPSTTPILEKGNAKPWLWLYEGIVSPIPKFSAAAKGLGVNVTAPEPDGVVRKMPMLIRVNGKIYPSQILENVRIINQSKRIKVVTGANGIEEVLVKKDAGVPVNHNAEMYIHYTHPDNILEVSAGDVMSGEVPIEKLQNRIVVVGLDAAGLSYLKDTPFQLMTDQQITAQALDMLVKGKYLIRPANADMNEIMVMALLGLLLIIVLPRTGVLWSVPVLLLSTGAVTAASWFGYAKQGFLIDASFPTLFIAVIWSHSVYNNFVTQHRLRQQIKRQFEHYLAPDMVKKLQKDPSLLKLGGETRTMTFMFSDIRGFTPISEKYKGDPEGLTKLINRFLTRMTDIIIKNGGTIDKFMGDCIMAFWNAPIEDGLHEENAVQAAIEMQEELKLLNEELSKENLPNINIGIGINTGEALVGNMGSNQRFDYSVIGDAVNLASRLESSSKTLGKTLVIGENTVKAAKYNYDFDYVDEITVKGKTEPIKVFTIKS